jgi:uncharacterized protein YciI
MEDPMHFLVIAYDGTDDQAPARRMAARERHLARMEQLKREGRALLGAALIDEKGNMTGSAVVYDFDTREDFEEYLRSEPYVEEGVWKQIEVKQCRVPLLFLDKNTSRTMYEPFHGWPK